MRIDIITHSWVWATIFILLLAAPPSPAETVRTSWGGDAVTVYETGFMHGLMRAPGGGVRLFNRELVENDSPGVGMSERGPNLDAIWGERVGRKVFDLDDPRARGAWIAFMPAYGRPLAHPLAMKINGHDTVYSSPATKQTVDYYRWLEFPAEWLRKGRNTVDFSCPDAESENEGWFIFFARADDYPQGGGDPSNVGKTSFKSVDGGKHGRKPVRPDEKTRGEYVLRLSLDRFERTGWLATGHRPLEGKGRHPDHSPARDTKAPSCRPSRRAAGHEDRIPSPQGIESPAIFGRLGAISSVGSDPRSITRPRRGLNRRYVQIRRYSRLKTPCFPVPRQ